MGFVGLHYDTHIAATPDTTVSDSDFVATVTHELLTTTSTTQDVR